MTRVIKRELITIAVLFAILIGISFIPAKGILKLILHLIPYFLTGFTVFVGLVKTVSKKNIFSGYTTLVLASVLAIITGKYAEATVILLLFRLGKLFCDFVKDEALKGVDASYKSDRKNTEKFVEKISRIMTPAALVLSLVVVIIGLIASVSNWREDICRGAVLIAVSYPATLVFSLPLAFGAGIGKAMKEGVRIKSSYSVDRLSKCATAVFDKTGTLTDADFTVDTIHPERISAEQLVDIAAAVMSSCDSRISRALNRISTGTLDRSLITNTRELDGLGAVAYMSEKIIAVGNKEMMDKLSIAITDCQHDGGTVIHISLGQTYLGHIVLTDNIREDADRALYRMKTAGVHSIVMLSEDGMSATAKVADTLHAIDEYHPGLRPEDKARVIEEIFAESAENETLVFVADGVRNAQILASADVSITLGGVDSDDTDVVIEDTSLEKIPLAMKIAKDVITTVKVNVAVSLGVKLIVAVLGIIGIMSISTAVFIDICVTLLATLNSLKPLLKKTHGDR